MKIYDNINQGTSEWLSLRAGKFTGSDFHSLLGNSETKKKILYKKAIERLTNTILDEDNITSKDIERGKEEEKNARLLYEMETNQEVQQIGFAELDEWVGCSPDGLTSDNGIIEIKCPKDVIFAQQVITDNIKPEYITQMQFNMYVLNKEYCDYVMYNRDFKLFIKRIARDNDYIEKIKESIEECKTIVKDNMEQLKQYKL